MFNLYRLRTTMKENMVPHISSKNLRRRTCFLSQVWPDKRLQFSRAVAMWVGRDRLATFLPTLGGMWPGVIWQGDSPKSTSTSLGSSPSRFRQGSLWGWVSYKTRVFVPVISAPLQKALGFWENFSVSSGTESRLQKLELEGALADAWGLNGNRKEDVSRRP